MKHNNYFPRRQADQVLWVRKFKNNLPGHATTLGLAAGTVTAAVADAAWLDYVLGSWLPAVRGFDKAATGNSTSALSGVGGSAQTLSTFTAPGLSGATAVNPGALSRIFALVQSIKNDGKCTDAIAADLGIVGTEDGAPDLTTLQPVISAKVTGAEVALKWGWQGFSAWLATCQIMVDRGDGKGFVLLCVDTTPNYIDTQPFPATRTIWTYKAIYGVDGHEVGRWSDSVSVTVGG